MTLYAFLAVARCNKTAVLVRTKCNIQNVCCGMHSTLGMMETAGKQGSNMLTSIGQLSAADWSECGHLSMVNMYK